MIFDMMEKNQSIFRQKDRLTKEEDVVPSISSKESKM